MDLPQDISPVSRQVTLSELGTQKRVHADPSESGFPGRLGVASLKVASYTESTLGCWGRGYCWTSR